VCFVCDLGVSAPCPIAAFALPSGMFLHDLSLRYQTWR
jgi:hypothetical protein